LGRMRDASEEVWEAAEVVDSVRIVVLWAMQELEEVSWRARWVVKREVEEGEAY
jgi:hypothetical protein